MLAARGNSRHAGAVAVKAAPSARRLAVDEPWSAIKSDNRAVSVDRESELGANLDAVTHGGERFADKIFIHVGPIAFRGVEKRNSALRGRADD